MDYRSKFFKEKVDHIFKGQSSELMLVLKKIVINMSDVVLSHQKLLESSKKKKEKSKIKFGFQKKGKKNKESKRKIGE